MLGESALALQRRTDRRRPLGGAGIGGCNGGVMSGGAGFRCWQGMGADRAPLAVRRAWLATRGVPHNPNPTRQGHWLGWGGSLSAIWVRRRTGAANALPVALGPLLPSTGGS